MSATTTLQMLRFACRRTLVSRTTTTTTSCWSPNNVIIPARCFATDDSDKKEEDASSQMQQEATIDPSLYTHKVPIRMPDLDTGKNKLVAWYKQPGDILHRNDVLCDIETSTFTFGMVMEDEEDSIMGEILVPAGEEEVEDNAIICISWHKEES